METTRTLRAREAAGRGDRLKIEGEVPLVAVLERPLRQALAGRRARYRVRVERVGDCGELRVSIASANQVLPLRFAEDELDPGYFRSVVRYSLDRFGF